MNPQLQVAEIFHGIQGESTWTGLPCSFVRLAGCDRSCRWCDTVYARSGGTPMTVDEILARVQEMGAPLVEVTGGEPLLQEGTPELLRALVAAGHTVLLETGGHRDIGGIDPRVIRILDLKCPSSGEAESNLWTNIRHLRRNDEVKFVIANRGDYEWAREVIRTHRLDRRCHVILSPVFDEMDPKVLSRWILDDSLPVRLGLQIHKYIWGPDIPGV